MLVHVANMASHLSNASGARLGLTSLPNTKHTLALSLALQKAGFLSSVVRAGPTPPPLLTPTSLPSATSEEGRLESELTQSNVASRRIWVGLKYWNQFPVLSKVKMESTPKQRKTITWRDLAKVIRGGDAAFVRGLRRTGECLFILTDKGLMEAREAVDEEIGGLVLCRAY